MLDAVYRDFGTGYVPRWHADIIDPERFHLVPPRHTLLVAVDERDGTVAATAALDARGPEHPPNPAGSPSVTPRARPPSCGGCTYGRSTGGVVWPGDWSPS